MSRRRPMPVLVGNNRLQNDFLVHYNAEDVNDSVNVLGNNHVCRICKRRLPQEQSLINPCGCSQQNKYVHQCCLLRWLANVVEQAHARGEDLNSSLKCELCYENYKVKHQTNRRCSCGIFCRTVKERGCPSIVWPILAFMLLLAVLTPTTILSMTGAKDSLLFIANQTAQYVVLGLTILCSLLVLVLLAVYLHNNLTYIEIVLEKAYNFDEEVSQGSKTSSSEEGRIDGGQYFVVTWRNRNNNGNTR